MGRTTLNLLVLFQRTWPVTQWNLALSIQSAGWAPRVELWANYRTLLLNAQDSFLQLSEDPFLNHVIKVAKFSCLRRPSSASPSNSNSSTAARLSQHFPKPSLSSSEADDFKLTSLTEKLSSVIWNSDCTTGCQQHEVCPSPIYSKAHAPVQSTCLQREGNQYSLDKP